MILSLRIQNFIVISHAEIHFSKELNILSGETGAGKSTVIKALMLLLGESNTGDFIQPGYDSSFIEGIFEKPKNIPDHIASFLTEEDETLIIYRKWSKTGKPVIRINNQTAPLKTLKLIASHLIQRVKQHEQLDLFESGKQLHVLDLFLGPKFLLELAEYRENYSSYTQIKKKVLELTENKKENLAKIEFISFQIQDIQSVKPKPDEDKILETQLQAFHTFKDSHKQVKEYLSALENALSTTQDCSEKLSELTENSKENIPEKLRQISFQIEDVIGDIKKKINPRLQLSDHEAEEADDRLSVLFRIQKKYHARNSNELLAYLEKLKLDLSHITEASDELESAEKQLNILEKKLIEKSTVLHKYRTNGAKSFEAEVTKHLKAMGLDNATLSLDLHFSELNLGHMGGTKVNILLSTNKGHPLQPIANTISGGELSRLFLAIQCVLPQDENKSFLLDEIDSGIGGEVANDVGLKLKELSNQYQVIAITHWAQIAQHAHAHFKIEKNNKTEKTESTIERLDATSKKVELKRMIGGQQVISVTH